jgi:Putative metallopeptidase
MSGMHKAAFVGALAWTMLQTGPVLAQRNPVTVPDNPQIEIKYGVPKNANYRPIRERLVKRGVLEVLRKFLSPVTLRRKLLVQIDECNGDLVRPYVPPNGTVTVCYEYIAKIERLAGTGGFMNGRAWEISKENAIVGAFVQELLHEVALGVFDTLPEPIPIWGKEEDAADYVSALIMLSINSEVALRTISGVAWFLMQQRVEDFYGDLDLADVRSYAAQRLQNYLCIAYGADEETFEPLVGKLLAKDRAATCSSAFEQLQQSFDNTIKVYMDPKLTELVRRMELFKPDDGK